VPAENPGPYMKAIQKHMFNQTMDFAIVFDAFANLLRLVWNKDLDTFVKTNTNTV
jgi:hypothetical protein